MPQKGEHLPYSVPTARRRAGLARAFRATGLPDAAIATRLGLSGALLTRLRTSAQTPGLFYACLLASAFEGKVALEDFLSPKQLDEIAKVRGLFTTRLRKKSAA